MSDIVERLRRRVDHRIDMEASHTKTLEWEAADEIDRLWYENASLASWQCEFTDGKTGLVYAEGGGTYCAMAKEVTRLRAALREIAGHPRGGMIDTSEKFDRDEFIGIARAALGEKP